MSFSTSRFIQLIKRDLIYYKKTNWIALVCIPLTVLMIFYLQELTEESAFTHNFFLSWFNIFLFGGGLVFTSMIMWEFRTAAGRAQYLTLPASNFEKLLTRFIYTLLVYPLFIFAIFFIIGVSGKVYSDTTTLWFFMSSTLKLFLVLHAALLLASVWFNNYSGPKAFLYSFALFFILVIIISFLFRIVFYDAFEGFAMFNEDIKIEPTEAFQKQVENFYAPVLEKLLWIGLPVFLWIVSYFKMKEKEA